MMSLLNFNLFASTNWIQVVEEEGVKVFTRELDDQILPFRAEAKINHNIEIVLKALINDKDKPNWAPKLKRVKIHSRSHNGQVFSEYYKTPWPAIDREFLLKGNFESITNQNKSSYKLYAHSVSEENLKKRWERKEYIQADVKKIEITLTELSKKDTQMTFEFHGDLKGWMPVWLMNLIQKKWPLRFIQGLRSFLDNKEKI